MRLAPTLNSCRPRLHVKSSRNWYLCWAVVCGVLTLWATVTRLGYCSVGSVEFSPMWLWKYENWKTNSFSRPPPITVLRLALMEWNLFLLVPHDSGGEDGLVP